MYQQEHRRALFLNWRCPKHSKAGGAEYAFLQLAKGLVAAGWKVTWFSMADRGLPATEISDGITFIRSGGTLTVQGAARRWYKTQPARTFDIIIDQSHGWPFFAPLWAKEPVIYMINEVTGEIAPYMLPWPLGYFYLWLEHLIIYIYRHTPAVTISQSTKEEMRRYGHRAPITVITLGLDTKPLKELPPLTTKESRPTVIFAARLVPLKRPDEAIRMQAELVKKIPSAQLWILGQGEERYVRGLKSLAEKLGVNDSVTFFGFVSLKKRQELMLRAHILTITSVKEGWGLTVPESNALGTVAVTYNIGGVRDSNKNGLLVLNNTPTALAEGIAKLIKNHKKYDKMRRAGWEWTKTLSWERASAAFYNVVRRVINRNEDSGKK